MEKLSVQQMRNMAPAGEGQMQNSKYQELKKHVQELQQKVQSQHKLLTSSFVLLKNQVARVDAMSEILASKQLITEDELQTLVDHKLGLRLKTTEEVVAYGDVVWVDYSATMEGSDQTWTDSELPVRVGSNALVFESSLIGKKVGDKGIEFEATYNQGENAGKKMKFTIDIKKAKTRLKQGVTNGNGNGNEQPEDAAEVEPGRPGVEEPSPSLG